MSGKVKQLNNSFIFLGAILKNVGTGFSIFDVALMALGTIKLLFSCFTFSNAMHGNIENMEASLNVITQSVGEKETIK